MRNRPYGFEIYLVNVKTMRTIAQIFVAFSEKLNFNEFFDTALRHIAKVLFSHFVLLGLIKFVSISLVCAKQKNNLLQDSDI